MEKRADSIIPTNDEKKKNCRIEGNEFNDAGKSENSR